MDPLFLLMLLVYCFFTSAGVPRHAGRDNYLLLNSRAREKQRTYGDIERQGAGKLIIAGTEVYGRFGRESLELLRVLVKVRASRLPAAVRKAAVGVCLHRWAALIGCAVQKAGANCFLFD